MFTGEKAGRAEEAINFYLSVFKHTKKGSITRYSKDMEPNKEGTIQFADVMLEDTWFAVMDSGYPHGFDFNESISFIVTLRGPEIDRLLLGKAFRSPRSRAVRLAERQIRRLLADHSDSDG